MKCSADMRDVKVSSISDLVCNLCIKANTVLETNVVEAMNEALSEERSPIGREIIGELIENAEIASKNSIAMCQDTGISVVYVEIGHDVHLVGGDLYEAINEGVRRGYTDGYLRKSVVSDPLFSRTNTKDNSPAVVHVKLVEGNEIKVTVAPKGAGSENMSVVQMLTPSSGIVGVKKVILDCVKRAGANSCPPMAIVGVGIGGTMEKAAELSKESLLRPIGSRNPDERYANLEEELLREINDTGIGPGGLGGTVTALDVHIEWFPTHIACLPVAVNIQCNACRHASGVI